MWRRYRWLAVTAPLLGFVAGVVVWAATDLGRNRQYRENLDFLDAVRAALPLGLIGLAVAVAALAGGWSLVASRDRGLTRPVSERCFLAAGGSVLGMLVLAIAVGLVLAGDGLFVWYGLFLVGIPVSIVTALCAGWLVYLAERWHRRTPPPPVEHLAASPWTDF